MFRGSFMKDLHRSEGVSVASMDTGRETVGRKRRVTSFGVRARLLTGFALVAGLITYGMGLPAATASTNTVRITLGGGTDFTDAVIYYADTLLGNEGINVEL